MSSVKHNPSNIETEYLACLNKCFKDWGDEKTYDWYFKRKTVFPPPDLIVFKQNDEFAAGSAVSYRHISAEDSKILIGIMSGSWTLPKFRQQGFFTKIIEESIKATKIKGAELLLAFVTEENSSSRQLAKFGATMIPAFYLFSGTETKILPNSTHIYQLEKTDDKLLKIYQDREQTVKKSIHFSYDCPSDFAHQYIYRLNQTEIYTDEQGSFGIIEKSKETDVLQFFQSENPKNFLGALLNLSKQDNRKFFLFTTDAEIAAVCIELGLGKKKGFISILQLEQNYKFFEHWNVQSGDRL
jgi:hypothetical protein